jgi:Holliday junction resolvase
MAKTPEGVVKDAVKKILKARGAWYFMPVSNGMGQVGIPDIIACYRGIFIAIETKATGKRANVTPNQQRVIEAIQKADGFAWVVDNPYDVPLLLDSVDAYFNLEFRNAQIDPSQT